MEELILKGAVPLLSAVFAAGAAWGGVRRGVRAELNGSAKRIERIEDHVLRIEDKLDASGESLTSVRERLATIEGFCPMCRR